MTALTPTRRSSGLPGWSTDFDQIVGDLLGTAMHSGSKTGNSQIVENDDSYEWSVDMPGVDREDIDVKLSENGILHASTIYEDSDENSIHRRSYSYSVRVRNAIDIEDISAEYENGVLTVTLPKRDRERDVKQIEVS